MGEWEGAVAPFLKAPAIRKTLKAKKTLTLAEGKGASGLGP